MTAPAVQPVEQPRPQSTRTTTALALALWQANSEDDATAVIAWLLLLDIPTAHHLVTITWHVTVSHPRPWRKTPASVAAHMQAGYLQNAAERIQVAADEAGHAYDRATLEHAGRQVPAGGTAGGGARATPGTGTPMTRAEAIQQAIDKALNREAYYAQLHRRAQARRATAFVASKKLQRRYGRLLGWKATVDKRTSLACRLADGANYDAVTGPWPGTLHGGTCRCRPAAPRANAPMVVDVWRRHGMSEHAEGAA